MAHEHGVGILSVTRIQPNNMILTKTEEAADEIISQAVLIVRTRYPAANLAIVPPKVLLLAPMDALLITHVMNNLALRVNTANLRRKIEENSAHPQFLLTEIGVGSRMMEGDEEEFK